MVKRILLLLTVLIFVGPAYGYYINPDDAKKNPIRKAVVQNSWAGGQNDRDFVGLLGPNQAAVIKNAVIEDNGVIKKRDGLDVVGDDTGDNSILGHGVYTPSDGSPTLIRAEDTVIKRLSGSSWTDITTGLTADLPTHFVVANDYLFIMNGTDRIRYSDSSWSVTTFGNGATEPPLGKIAVFVKNRMFIVDEEDPSWIRYSDAGDPTTYTAINDLPINRHDGQRIMALVPFKNDLLVFKEGSIWAVEMTGADPVDNWAVSLVDNNFGTYSTNSVQQLATDILFLDQYNQVRSLLRSRLDTLEPGARPFSDTIRTTLDGLNRAQINKVAAYVFGDNYFLAFPSGSSIYNDALVVYNLRQKSWVEYTGWSASCWTAFEISDVFYLIMGEASEDSLTYQCFSGDDDNGSDIDFDLQTREYNLEYPGDKMWALADVICHVTSGDLTILAQFNSNGWQSLGTLDMGGDAPRLPQTLPFNLGNEAVARGKFLLASYGRSRGMQLRFRSNNTDKVTLRRLIVFGRLLPLEKY